MLNININSWMERDLAFCDYYVTICVEDANNWWLMGSDETIEDARARMANEQQEDPEHELGWYIINPFGELVEEG